MFKRLLLAVLLGLCVLWGGAEAQTSQVYFKFSITSPEELHKLTNIISIDNVKGTDVYAYANDIEFANFQTMGYSYEILPNPGSLINPRMTGDKDLALDWDYYPTYSAYLDLMTGFANDYPDLCQIILIGYTVQGRQLLFVKLSANVNIEEDEPEIMYSSSMHGDETTGYILMLHLIDYLLSNYGIDPQATNILDNSEVWINPLANPDGTYHGGNNTVNGAIRYNANYVDLNRNFPDFQDGPHPDGYSWQPETEAMMAFFDLHSFTISANFHGGVEVVNYPFDTVPRLHPDNDWYVSISREYADSAHANSPSGYMTFRDNGITNGYAWYEVNGGRQDYLNYWKGDREVTIELSNTKLLPAGQLLNHWNYNRAALLTFIEQAFYGIRGIVTDAQTGLPVAATISVGGHDADSSEVYTDPDVGDYHRMIAPGTYSLRFTAPGYVAQAVTGITVTSRNITRADVQLQPLSSDPVLSFYGHDAGRVNAGDSVNMNITLVNDGGGNAYGVTATLSTSDSYVNIQQPTSTYPTINSLGGTGTSLSDYVFTVSPSCPPAHAVDFRLDISESSGYTDSAFFTIVVGLTVEDFETGDFSSFPWQFSGSANWYLVTSDVYEGAYSARSGVITHNQSSILSIDWESFGQDSIAFAHKVSSEATYDSLKFYIDDVLKEGWSGEQGWGQAVYPVSAGTHNFKWEYMKDYSVSNGSDCGWIDYIIFPRADQPLQITTPSLPDWTINHPYASQLQAEGGVGARSWSDLNNDLNGTGLALTSGGQVSGTPTATGTITFTAHVEDEADGEDNHQYQFDINPALVITTASLPDWTQNYPYSQQLEVTGGTGNKTWSDLNDDLAGTGLSISNAGLLSGTPSVSGEITFTAHVQDAIGANTQQQFQFDINPAIVINTESLPDWTVGIAYSQQLEATGGTGNLTWEDLHGDLADYGLTISDNGLVVGMPSTAGDVSFTARVTDSLGAPVDRQFDFTLNAAVQITTSSLPDGITGEPYSYQMESSGGTGDITWNDRDGDLEGTGLALSDGGLLEGTPTVGITVNFFARAVDNLGSSDEQYLSITFESSFIPGDVNGDDRVIGSDVTYLVSYFRGIVPAPDPLLAGDANGDCSVIGSDVTYLVNYFRGGNPPVMGDCGRVITGSKGK